MEKLSKKLLVSSCLFCVNSSTSVRKFKITEDYGGGNTIKYDLTSFLGHQIESYLKDDDLLCSNCMNFFENMAYTKRRLIEFLRNRDESEDIKMQGFSDIWKGFKKFAVTLVKFNPNDSDEAWDTTDLHNRSLTPNPLVHTHSEPYNQAYENRFSETESLKAYGSEVASETDLEVRRLFGKRHKKRGHNWTRRRGEQKSRALSRTYPDIHDLNPRNCNTSFTTYSASSCDESTYRSKTATPRRKRKVHGKPVKTRSVSRLENYLANFIAEKELNRYYCEEVNCDLYYDEIEKFVLHKRYDHNIIARFPCQQCRFKATTKAELDAHTTKAHDVEVMCFQCKALIHGIKNLQDHLKKHQEYSVGCNFCYLNFLTKAELVEHVSNEHQGKKRKKIHEKPSYVLQTLVNKEKMKSSVKNLNNNGSAKNEFKAIILRAEKEPSPEVEIPSIFNSATSAPTSNVPVTISDHSNEKTLVTTDKESEKIEIPIDKSPQLNMSDYIIPINTNSDSAVLEDNLQLNHLTPVVIIERCDFKKFKPNL